MLQISDYIILQTDIYIYTICKEICASYVQVLAMAMWLQRLKFKQ